MRLLHRVLWYKSASHAGLLASNCFLPNQPFLTSIAHHHHVSSAQEQQQHLTNMQIQRRFSVVTASRRYMGSRAGVPGNPPGEIHFFNEQSALKLDDSQVEALKDTVASLRQVLGYETYDVTLILVNDKTMRETNRETRGIFQPTDILSFPFHLPQEPGVLEEPEFDIPDYYALGDMMIDVPYVIRRCKEDKQILEEDKQQQEEEEEDRGVSGAMATVFDPERRLHMLLVHGMLHLVGYDHEEDDDYEQMVNKEEELLYELGMLPTSQSQQD